MLRFDARRQEDKSWATRLTARSIFLQMVSEPMGEFMSVTMESMRQRTDSLAFIGGILMLVDTVWGGMLALGFDLSHMNELALGISFVLGFPTYLLDLLINRRIAISILGLFLFRWLCTCFGGPTPMLVNPLRVNTLLIVAFVLLQVSKLRREGKSRQTAHPAGD